jgi:5,10-methylenetetrahydrofolate reductase
LLLLSGGHPARRLPGANLLLNDSFKLLKLASYLKSTQQIPNTVSLWAVENPLVSPPSRIKAKVEAGADVVLTQPPLLPDQSASFFEQAAADGTMEKAKIIIGVPMAPSVRNLDFWLRLADARNLPEAEAVLNSFPRQTNNNGGDGKEKGGAEEEEEYWNTVKEWNVEFIRGSLKIPGVAGLHVMPLTAAARKMTMELLQEGAFSVI